jgi:hypothetical protein
MTVYVMARALDLKAAVTTHVQSHCKGLRILTRRKFGALTEVQAA